jgi:hypothetical protein
VQGSWRAATRASSPRLDGGGRFAERKSVAERTRNLLAFPATRSLPGGAVALVGCRGGAVSREVRARSLRPAERVRRTGVFCIA